MPIRLANSGDLISIKSIAEAAYAKYTVRIGRKPAPMVADFQKLIKQRYMYVFIYNGEVAGFVVFYPSGDHMHLENIAISPELQGKGIGLQLIEFVEQQSRAQDFQAVELYTNEKMTENLNWYPSIGYQEKDRHEEDGFSRVYFRKIL